MGKRDAQSVTLALVCLDEAREALLRDSRQEAIDAMSQARGTLELVEHARGLSVAHAARLLGVSEPTVRSWAARGALRAIRASRPLQIEPGSVREASRALDELRKRGRDRAWLTALAEHLDDRAARRGEALREGLSQLERGELEPA